MFRNQSERVELQTLRHDIQSMIARRHFGNKMFDAFFPVLREMQHEMELWHDVMRGEGGREEVEEGAGSMSSMMKEFLQVWRLLQYALTDGKQRQIRVIMHRNSLPEL